VKGERGKAKGARRKEKKNGEHRIAKDKSTKLKNGRRKSGIMI
jgi:hypothetical protein